MISKETMDVLACPECKGELKERKGELVCDACKLNYKIVDGIPDLMPKKV